MSKHSIVHVEISSSDRLADGEFYAEVFGWKVAQMDDMNYATFETGEGEAGGGLSPIMEDYPAGTILVYINTDNIEETVKKIEDCGGSLVVPRTEIPGGWFALFTDRTGNRMGLFEEKKQ
jgi:predicted enzyme related to lactoylglutathione lyase